MNIGVIMDGAKHAFHDVLILHLVRHTEQTQNPRGAREDVPLARRLTTRSHASILSTCFANVGNAYRRGAAKAPKIRRTPYKRGY